tara:strand:- start:24341 stop:25642 length:1302 start_codon:yes stop_codon:yes gene_type:complete
MKKKVLIITYYWPPMGGGGVQRWLKTTKYIRDFGWEPVIFTADNAEISIYDESLISDLPDKLEVIKSKIWEPFGLYKKLMGMKDEKINPGFLQKSRRSSFLQYISIWIRGNFFIPDAKIFWLQPSVEKIEAYLKENKIDAIISTGPPHTTHLIANSIISKYNIPWIADFRDPWTNIDFYHKLKLTPFADRKHRSLEKTVLRNADKIVTVSKSWASDFKHIIDVDPIVIHNGYDPSDFVNKEDLCLDEDFSITHIGSLNEDRNPYILWKVLAEMIRDNEDFSNNLKIQLIGPIDITVKEDLSNYGLMDNTVLIESLPHNQVIDYIIKSQILLLPLNNVPNIDGVIPGKMYEYIGAKRPILCIGKEDGDAAEIIKATQTGKVVSFSDESKLKNELISMYTSYKDSSLTLESQDYTKYSRKLLASKFANLLDIIAS